MKHYCPDCGGPASVAARAKDGTVWVSCDEARRQYRDAEDAALAQVDEVYGPHAKLRRVAKGERLAPPPASSLFDAQVRPAVTVSTGQRV